MHAFTIKISLAETQLSRRRDPRAQAATGPRLLVTRSLGTHTHTSTHESPSREDCSTTTRRSLFHFFSLQVSLVILSRKTMLPLLTQRPTINRSHSLTLRASLSPGEDCTTTPRRRYSRITLTHTHSLDSHNMYARPSSTTTSYHTASEAVPSHSTKTSNSRIPWASTLVPLVARSRNKVSCCCPHSATCGFLGDCKAKVDIMVLALYLLCALTTSSQL